MPSPLKYSSILILATAILISFNAKAQMDYPIFKHATEIKPSDSEKLTLSIYNLSYINNTEYFGKIPYSGTLFGYQLIPELEYQPTSRFLIRAGVYAQKEFGRKEYTSLLPTFSVKYKAKHSSYILGTLEGNINHGFIEPIYDYKLLLNERMENGFQFFVDTKHYNHDFYINWRRAIHLGDPYKEEFDIGYSAKINLINKPDFQLKVPVQMLYSHKGGQLDADKEQPLTSLVNSALGISLNLDHRDGFLRGLGFDNYYVNYKDISGTKVQPFNEGNAYLSHLLMKFKYFDIDLRYWKGEGFINPRGNALFGSLSQTHPGYFEKNRTLFFASFIYNTTIFKGANFNFRVTPYHDFGEKITEYSYEMYFSYQLDLLLGKIKNSLN
ncbi:MAG: hypothetical protein ABI204_02705 [Ginsengibacter sp.]